MRAWSGVFGVWLLLSLGCEQSHGPQTGTPGFEPPRDLDAGEVGEPQPDQASGNGSMPPSGTTVPPAVAQGGAGGAGGSPGFGNAGGSPIGDITDGGVIDGGVLDPLLVGLWVIDQPSHALYEATLYELAADGSLIEHDTYTLSAPDPDYVTGTVANADSSVRCAFSDSWRSLGDRRLELHSTCGDNVARAVVVVLPEGDESAGLMATVESVNGESGWDHRDFPWSWRKCASRSDCMPF